MKESAQRSICKRNEATMDASWIPTITSGLVSGIVVTAGKAWFDYTNEERKRKRSICHLALKLAVQFEGYAWSCIDLAANHQIADQTQERMGAYLPTVPELASLPESDAYDFVDIQLLDTILGFPQRRQMAVTQASFWWDLFGDGDDFRDSLHGSTVKLAHAAMQIARQLRVTYKLSQRRLTWGDTSFDDHLNEQLNQVMEAEDRRRSEAAAQGNTLAELVSPQ